MSLNKYHAMFVTGPTILEFLKSNNLGYSGNSVRSQALIDYINSIEDKIDSIELNQKVYEWMYQGRRKIVFTDLEYGESCKYKGLSNIDEFRFENEGFQENLEGILNLNISGDEEQLLDIVFKIKNENKEYEYIFKSNSKNSTIEGDLEEIIFVYSKTDQYIDRLNEDFMTNNIKIVIPIFVTLDLLHNEICSRIPAKVNIYDVKTEEKLEDIQIAKTFLQKTINKLGLTLENRLQYIDKFAKCIFDIHLEITKLPQEVIDKRNSVSGIVCTVVDDIVHKLDLGLNDVEIEAYKIRESMIEGINNVILKEILKTYGDEDIALFEQGKYATSIGIKSRAASYATLNYNSKLKTPIQCNPEYMNVENIISEVRKLNKNIILWNGISKKPGIKIRTKLYIENDGYGVISFEEYTLEEDICNVLSKIREVKGQQ